MKHFLVLVYLIVITLGLTNCYAPPPQTSHIAFVSKRSQLLQIYLMDSQGQQQTQFTHAILKPDAFSFIPPPMAWSPDGSTLAFNTGNYELCTQEIFTNSLKCFHIGDVFQMAWSPNGQWLAIARRDFNALAIPRVLDGFELDVGTSPFPITTIKPMFPIRHTVPSTEGCSRDNPTWSRDSEFIAFTLDCLSQKKSYQGFSTGIYTIGRDGQNEQQVYNTDKYISGLSWSPNGKVFAFAMQVEDDPNSPQIHPSRRGNYEIYRININGTDLTRLTDNSGLDHEPTWSPDGQFIAFSSNRRGNYDVYVMKADGSDVHALTDDPADDYAPLWSPR